MNVERGRRLAAPSRGFTLIELLVALSIVAIAATLAGPRLFSAADKFTLNSAGRQLVAVLREIGRAHV